MYAAVRDSFYADQVPFRVLLGCFHLLLNSFDVHGFLDYIEVVCDLLGIDRLSVGPGVFVSLEEQDDVHGLIFEGPLIGEFLLLILGSSPTCFGEPGHCSESLGSIIVEGEALVSA